MRPRRSRSSKPRSRGFARVAEVAGAATGRPVILQTLAGDPDAVRFNMDLGLPGSPRSLTGEFNRRLVQQARQQSRLVLDVNALAAWSDTPHGRPDAIGMPRNIRSRPP